jgi:hypothetical protein
MKPATIQQIKQEFSNHSATELLEVCLRLAKFKKENKELLSYLLFYANDEQSFANDVKNEMDELFAEINKSHVYYAKKSLRKILRIINKYSRYSPKTETDVELRIHFVLSLKASGIPLRKEKQILKLYEGQLLKIKKSIAGLHEDIQYDYLKLISGLDL